jgi:Domain of unknown function (DUF4381)
MQPELPLRDIHLPDAISWWSLAVGWWITLVLIPILLWISFKVYKYLTRKTAIKTAKKILTALKQDKTKSKAQKVMEISALIRRVAMSVDSRKKCAGLTGQEWLEYLDKPLKYNGFTQGVGQHLVDVCYRKNNAENINVSELINLAECWLKKQQNF